MNHPDKVTTSPVTPATASRRKPSQRRLKSLLRSYLRTKEASRKVFTRQTEQLDLLIASGMPLNQPLEIDGRVFRLVDQFESSSTVFSAKKFDRYVVQEIKQARPARKGKEGN